MDKGKKKDRKTKLKTNDLQSSSVWTTKTNHGFNVYDFFSVNFALQNNLQLEFLILFSDHRDYPCLDFINC